MSKQTSTLEQQNADMLRNERSASSEIYRQLAETEAGILEAQQTAIAERERSRDPELAPDPAEGLARAQLAELRSLRLQKQTERLRDHLERALDRERREKFATEHQRLRPLHDAAKERFKRVPELLTELADIFAEARNVDALTEQLAFSAPPNEPRRFAPVARTARIDFDGQQICPPRPPALDLSGYRPDDRLHADDCGPNWWKPIIAAEEAKAKRETAQLRDADAARDRFYGRVA